MPRKDVPLPGQGKRGRRKAWRDNADQAIAIYSLTAEEMPEIIATEEVMSQALPYWDDKAPQPQSQSPRQAYTEEEAQELGLPGWMATSSAWKSSLRTAKRPGLDWTQTGQDRKIPRPSKTVTAVQSSVSQDFGNVKTDEILVLTG